MEPSPQEPSGSGPRPGSPAPSRAAAWPVWGLAGLCATIEAVLILADHGWVGSTLWRRTAYANGAFWAGLLRDWQPNFPGQPATMFVTYAVLHAGPGHALGNLVVLVLLGRRAVEQFGTAGFALVCAVSTLGGALAFGLLSASPNPMVGCSGALFGLAGSLLADEGRRGRSVAWILGAAAGLMIVNAASLLVTGGQVAWQAHLGGALAGALAAPRPRLPRAPRA